VNSQGAERHFVIGVDFGTGGPSAIAKDVSGKVIADFGCGTVEHVGGTQKIADLEESLGVCIRGVLSECEKNGFKRENCKTICLSAQMHGLVVLDKNRRFINRDGIVRLWNYPGSSEEANILTRRLEAYFPQRLGTTRFAEYIRNYPDLASQIYGFTSPSGAMTMMLGGPDAYGLDYGEFIINTKKREYDEVRAEKFDRLWPKIKRLPLLKLLPPLYNVGTFIGVVNEAGSKLTGLPVGTPICVPTGDQPSAIAGAYVYEIGTAALSYGTSACLNHIIARLIRQFANAGCDPFTTTDGKDTIMNHIEWGTGFLNSVLSMYAGLEGFQVIEGRPEGKAFQKYMPMITAAADNCGGISAIPIQGPEHGLKLPTKGQSLIMGLNGKNATVGNLGRAALTSPLYTLLYSIETMREAGIHTKEYVLTGGVLKGIKPFMGQLWANVFNTPARVYNDSCTEGSTDGAASMALYGHRTGNLGEKIDWPTFLREMTPKDAQVFTPQSDKVAIHRQAFEKFRQVVDGGALKKIVKINC
jgi:sugar (pentulose or hexulose) kinase